MILACKRVDGFGYLMLSSPMVFRLVNSRFDLTADEGVAAVVMRGMVRMPSNDPGNDAFGQSEKATGLVAAPVVGFNSRARD